MAKSKANRVVGMAAASENDWDAQDDLRTLMAACRIRQDPKRFKAAQAMAKKQLAEIKKVSEEKPGKY